MENNHNIITRNIRENNGAYHIYIVYIRYIRIFDSCSTFRSRSLLLFDALGKRYDHMLLH